MRFVYYSYESPITRDTIAAALKAPYKTQGIKAASRIAIVSDEGAAEIRKLVREQPKNSKRFEAFGLTVVAVPNDTLYRVIILGLPNTDEGVK